MEGEPHVERCLAAARRTCVAAVTRAVHKIHPGVTIVPTQASGATDGLVFRSVGIPTYGVDGKFMGHKDDVLARPQ